VLLETSERNSERVEEFRIWSPPPPSSAVFEAAVESVIATSETLAYNAPPDVAELSRNSVRSQVRVELEHAAPPPLLQPPPEFPRMMLCVSVAVDWMACRPPPDDITYVHVLL